LTSRAPVLVRIRKKKGIAKTTSRQAGKLSPPPQGDSKWHDRKERDAVNWQLKDKGRRDGHVDSHEKKGA